MSSSDQSLAKGITGAVVVLALVWFYFGGGLEKQAENDMQRIENQVAEDSVRQYQIAKRNGSAMDAYVHASLVAAAFLQAEDEANYQKWKQIERQEGVRAGMPAELLR